MSNFPSLPGFYNLMFLYLEPRQLATVSIMLLDLTRFS